MKNKGWLNHKKPELRATRRRTSACGRLLLNVTGRSAAVDLGAKRLHLTGRLVGVADLTRRSRGTGRIGACRDRRSRLGGCIATLT